ncbi:hypothetical protein CY35_18G081500 [Sphagnum magellanicum]|nr:hypothetical protein CY35_18G081500 [Sphagnum magellanicum]
MVAAAVAPSSSPTPAAAVQQEPPHQSHEKKNSEADNGGHHHHHVGGALAAAAAEKSNTAAVRKLRNREITSRYKAATVPGTLTPPATTTAAAAASGPRRNSSPLRQPSPSRQSSSPARNRSAAATEASSPPVRHPSPTPGRASSVNSPSDASKRSLSTERRRPWPAASARGSAEGGLASVKPHLVGAASPAGGRGSELWPSMNSASKVQSSSAPNGTPRTTTPPPPPAAPNGVPPFEARGKESNRSSSDHSLKPTANGAHLDRSADRALSSPQRKGSSPIRRRSIDQAENARPSANFLSKPDQQRWPGISNGKVFGGALTRSMDLSIDRERPLSRTATILIQSQQQPSSTPSRISRPSFASRSLNRSVNEGQTLPKGQATTPRQRNPTPTKGSRVVGPHISDSRSEAVVACTPSNGAQQRSYPTAGDDMSNNNNLLLRSSRGVLSMGTLDSCTVPFDSMSDTESVSSGGSGLGSGGSARGTSVPARVWQDMNTRLRRLSEGDRIRSPKSELAAAAAGAALGESKAVQQRSRVSSMGSQPSSPSTASMTGIMTSTCLLSPGGRVMSNNPGLISQLPLSPQYIKRSSSPLRGLPSPQRPRPVPGTTAMLGTGRNLGGCTIVNFGLDGWSRGRKALTQYEEAQLLRILHNRWLQWRFVNARAEAVISAQKTSAERSLYNVWVKTSELRTSVAKQRIKLQQARQAHRLRSILSTHVAHLEDWENLEEEHSSALTGAMEALESTILRVPVSGGAKVDVHAVGEALGSAVDVLNALQVSVSSLSPKAESMDVLLSQLAQTAAKERALLEECGDLLSVAATLEVEECSLRTHLIQLESEKGWSSATLPASGSKPQLLKTILLSPPGVERHALELEKVEVAQEIKR